MIDKILVGQKIFTLRKKMVITQDRLAKVVNVTPQAISKWEKGITLPDTYLLPLLSQLFHVSIEELLCVKTKDDQYQDKDIKRTLLTGLTYSPCIPSLVSCIKSSLAYLGIHVSTGWISAPYAFMLNINDEVSYMGPDYWNDNGCYDELIGNCGGIVENFSAFTDESDFERKREEAWHIIRASIDKGLPCYGWGIDEPYYYLIAGYDERGYYYVDPNSKKIAGPKPYNKLGEEGWGVLEIHIIRPGNISDSLKTLKDVFEYAVNVNNPKIYSPNFGYTMGVNAYKTWWEAIDNQTADSYGLAYNSEFWARCKKLAVHFLKEGSLRIGIMEDLFNRAIINYESAAKHLNRLSSLFPLDNKNDHFITGEQREEAVRLLKAAQASEIRGINEIGSILNEIYKVW